MKTERLTRILHWLREQRAHLEHGVINIPVCLKEDVIELVGDNEIFKELLIKNQVQKNFLYQRIMINREFAYDLAEEFWNEQFYLIQEQVNYFNYIKHKDIDPNDSADLQIAEKIEALRKLDYLNEISAFLRARMKDSKILMNELTYLLG